MSFPKMVEQRYSVATIQHELPAREHPFEYVPERLRLAVARLLLFGHAFLLAQKESPAGTITGRASLSCFRLIRLLHQCQDLTADSLQPVGCFNRQFRRSCRSRVCLDDVPHGLTRFLCE